MRRSTLFILALLGLCVLSLGYALLGGGEDPAPRDGAGLAADGGAPPPHLVVLNGAGVRNLAADVGLALGRAGCLVERVGNAPHDDFARSLLVVRRLDSERARELARRLGGVAVVPEFDPNAAEDAVLVLGADHARITAALGVPDGGPPAAAK